MMTDVYESVKETNPPIFWKKKTMVKDYAVSKETHLYLILLEMIVWTLCFDVHRYSNWIWITFSGKKSSNKFKYDNEFFIEIKLLSKIVIKDQKSQGMPK